MAQHNLIRLFVHTISRTHIVRIHIYLHTVMKKNVFFVCAAKVVKLPKFIVHALPWDDYLYMYIPLYIPYVWDIEPSLGGSCGSVECCAERLHFSLTQLHECFRWCRHRLFSAAVRISANVYLYKIGLLFFSIVIHCQCLFGSCHYISCPR